MSKTLTISPDLSLPRDIGTETIAVLGRRGSGKSNTGTVIIEQLAAAGQQFVLIDPKGEGWGLKARGAGGPGIDVIVFGEPEGDLPLREEHGETLAEFVVKSGRSVVLSLAGIDSDAAARRFVARFAERLYTLKKKPENHGPLMVVIEEAHLFVPQRVEGAQADVVSRLQRLVRQGRSMGIGVTLIDQRPASVNKDVLTQLELLICHQLTSPHDRKAIDAWIEANAEADQAAEFRKTLPTLQPGEAWIWSPAKLKLFVRVKVNPRATFDSGATPILGKDAAKRPAMRDVNLDELRGELERVVEEKKANDPSELKKKLAAAEKALTEAAAAKTPAPPPAKVEKLIVSDAQIHRLEQLAKKLFDLTAPIGDALTLAEQRVRQLEGVRDDVTGIVEAIERSIQAASFKAPPVPASQSHDRPLAIQRTPASPATVGDLKLSKKQQEILDAVAWYESIGNREPTLIQIGAVALIDSGGGHFSNVVGPLSSAGLVERGDGRIRLTDAGRAIAVAPETRKSLGEYHDVLRQRVRRMKSSGGKTIDILNAVVAANGKPLTVEQIGSSVSIDHTGGHFSNMIGPLSTAGLIKRSGGIVTPTDVLFPEGLK